MRRPECGDRQDVVASPSHPGTAIADHVRRINALPAGEPRTVAPATGRGAGSLCPDRLAVPHFVGESRARWRGPGVGGLCPSRAADAALCQAREASLDRAFGGSRSGTGRSGGPVGIRVPASEVSRAVRQDGPQVVVAGRTPRTRLRGVGPADKAAAATGGGSREGGRARVLVGGTGARAHVVDLAAVRRPVSSQAS